MSTSMTYELIEWGAAVFLGGELGMAYLGTQGDVWDGHKDMALASPGALISMTATGDRERTPSARLCPRVGGKPAGEAANAAR